MSGGGGGERVYKLSEEAEGVRRRGFGILVSWYELSVGMIFVFFSQGGGGGERGGWFSWTVGLSWSFSTISMS